MVRLVQFTSGLTVMHGAEGEEWVDLHTGPEKVRLPWNQWCDLVRYASGMGEA